MAKRFKNLKYALKTLRAPNSTQPVPDAPSGSIAREFQDYQAGKRVIEYTRAEDSKPEQILTVSILPFYYAGEAGKETLVPFSKRTSDRSDLNPIKTACNHVVASVDTHLNLNNFIPAKAVVTVYSGTETQAASQITGVRYQKKGAKSYTFPYGASTGSAAERDIRNDILLAVDALQSDTSVSFSSEKI